MADTRSILSTVLYCLWWPTSKILLGIRAILSPFLALAQFILLPVTYLLHGVVTVLLLPFQLHILERIETIYVWLGIAGLIGFIAGATLFLTFKVLSSALSIDAAAGPRTQANGRTMREYRATRRERQGTSSGSSSGPNVVRVARPPRRGLSSTAIMEEESEF